MKRRRGRPSEEGKSVRAGVEQGSTWLRTEKLYDTLLRLVNVGLQLALLLVVCAGVGFRYVLNDPLLWANSVAAWLFVWSVLIGSAVAVGGRGHIALDVVNAKLGEHMPAKVINSVRRFYYLSLLAVATFLIISGEALLDIMGNREDPSSGLPFSIVIYAMPAGGALMAVESVRALVKDIRVKVSLGPGAVTEIRQQGGGVL